jgi:hypothetical protein
MENDNEPNLARHAAKGGDVTIEDEPAVKTCSSCRQSLSLSSFSGAQLKLKAKRKCKACIQLQQQANEAQFASSASAASAASASASSSAKSTSSHRPSAAHSTTATDVLPSRCCVCNKRHGKLRTCSRCASAYCGLACLTTHKDSGLCAATRTLPPVDGIAEENRLSLEELSELWPALQRTCSPHQELHKTRAQRLPPELRHLSFSFDLSFSAAELTPLIELYPPRLDAKAVWWTPRCRQAQFNVAAVFDALRRLFDVIRYSTHPTSSVPDPALPHGWGQVLLEPPSPVFCDGRLIHRLLAYAIFFFRHVDPQLLPPDIRANVHVQSDEHGELPRGMSILTGKLCSIDYLSSVDDVGRRLLLPFFNVAPRPRPSFPLVSARPLECDGHRKMLLLSGPSHAPVREAGLLVMSTRPPGNSPDALLTKITAFAGWTADRLSSAVSDVCCLEANDALRESSVRRGMEPWPRCALIEVMRDTLSDQWPQPGQDMFIAVPRRGLETELTELLLLESLKAEADVGDAHAQLLLAHLVEESGAADVSELIGAQRSRVEEMQQWQQEQLRLHAEAVARTEQRASQRKAIKAAASSALAASAGVSSKPSAAAAVASHQIDERKHAPSSSASAAASASMAKAAHGHGNLAPNVSSALTPAQTGSAAELACSWTADAALTDVASLLQTGRRKFGVIVKAALKFLHSLQPTSVNQSRSHRVFHFAQSGPVTLVIPHAGRRSKDSPVSRQYCTRLYEAMQQATMSQFGPMRAGAQIKKAQPQRQLPAAGSSLASVALAELD